MKVIIIEDKVYRISEKEFLILSKKQDEQKEASYPQSDILCEELNEYLDAHKDKYKLVGQIFFDWRR